MLQSSGRADLSQIDFSPILKLADADSLLKLALLLWEPENSACTSSLRIKIEYMLSTGYYHNKVVRARKLARQIYKYWSNNSSVKARKPGLQYYL